MEVEDMAPAAMEPFSEAEDDRKVNFTERGTKTNKVRRSNFDTKNDTGKETGASASEPDSYDATPEQPLFRSNNQHQETKAGIEVQTDGQITYMEQAVSTTLAAESMYDEAVTGNTVDLQKEMVEVIEPVDFEIQFVQETDDYPGYEDEVIEVFKQLMELSSPGDAIELAGYGTVDSGMLSREDETQLEIETSGPVSNFKELIKQQIKQERVPAGLQGIKEAADNQKAEETLAQLVWLFIESPTDIELKEAARTISELAEILYPGQESGSKEAVKIDITPEVTQKLLVLLRQLGYQSPDKALIELVNRKDIGYILEAIFYLSQLSNPHNRQEFLRNASPTATTSRGKPLHSFMGKAAVAITGVCPGRSSLAA